MPCAPTLLDHRLHLCCLQIKDLGCKAGVVLNPATPLSSIEHVLSFVGESAATGSYMPAVE